MQEAQLLSSVPALLCPHTLKRTETKESVDRKEKKKKKKKKKKMMMMKKEEEKEKKKTKMRRAPPPYSTPPFSREPATTWLLDSDDRTASQRNG